MLLVTGANGQLGKALAQVLPDALLAGSHQLDITDSKAVRDFITAHKVDTIINCAAYTAVDKAEDDAQRAAAVNVTGAKNLACTGARIIHISTDYVFDGGANQPYTEEDATNPQSVYGRTKLEGERAVLDNAETAAVIRTSWLFSPYGHNFMKTMQRLGGERETLNVVWDQIGCPTSALSLSRAITALLPHLVPGSREIYHYADEGVCSWYDFAHEIMRQSGLSCRVLPIMSKDYPFRIPRPAYSVLDKSKIKAAFGLTIPHWTESLAESLKSDQR